MINMNDFTQLHVNGGEQTIEEKNELCFTRKSFIY